MPTRRPPKTIAMKREVVLWIEANCPQAPSTAATHFMNKGWKISAAQVGYWYKKKDEIKAAQLLQLRLKGGGTKPRLDLEDVLFDMVIRRRTDELKVSRKWIQELALARGEGYKAFAASGKWLSGFMERYGLSLRRTTNLTVLTDEQLVGRAVNNIAFLAAQRPTLDDKRTILMDETAVYFENPRRHTVDEIRARHVVLKVHRLCLYAYHGGVGCHRSW